MQDYEELKRQVSNTLDLADSSVCDLKAGATTDEEAAMAVDDSNDVDAVRTLIQSAPLAAELFQWGYDNTRSFDVHDVTDMVSFGVNLLYLIGAVLQNEKFTVIYSDNAGFVAVLRAAFKEDHEVWQYINDL